MLGEDVTAVLNEFLVVFIHAVAYACRVYPETTFSLVRQYGVATYENNHPGVRIWAENAVKAVMQLVYANDVSNKPAVVSIVVLEDSHPVERFGLELRKYLIREAGLPSSQTREVSAADVNEQFRACITRLYTAVGQVTPAGNRSLTVMFEGDPQLDEVPEAWITAGSQTESSGRLEPIREIDLHNGESIFAMNVFRQRAISK